MTNITKERLVELEAYEAAVATFVGTSEDGALLSEIAQDRFSLNRRFRANLTAKLAAQAKLVEAEARIAELLEALHDIEGILESHPESDKGNSKVHYAMHRARKATGLYKSSGPDKEALAVIRNLSHAQAEYLLDECVGVAVYDDVSEEAMREKVEVAFRKGQITLNEVMDYAKS